MSELIASHASLVDIGCAWRFALGNEVQHLSCRSKLAGLIGLLLGLGARLSRHSRSRTARSFADGPASLMASLRYASKLPDDARACDTATHS